MANPFQYFEGPRPTAPTSPAFQYFEGPKPPGAWGPPPAMPAPPTTGQWSSQGGPMRTGGYGGQPNPMRVDLNRSPLAMLFNGANRLGMGGGMPPNVPPQGMPGGRDGGMNAQNMAQVYQYLQAMQRQGGGINPMMMQQSGGMGYGPFGMFNPYARGY